MHLLDVKGNEIKLFRSHADRVNDVAISAGDSHVASCSNDGEFV